jgi:hypothetical protein
VKLQGLIALAALVSIIPDGCQAQGIRFQIDAQYRGTVKKSFNSIGDAALNVRAGTGGDFKVGGTARVTHPKDHQKVYQVSLDMNFRLRGDTVEYKSAHNSCNAGSEGLMSGIQKLLPFVYLVTSLPANAHGPRDIKTPHGTYTMNCYSVGPRIEVTIEKEQNLAGKFFLNRSTDGWAIERFRIPAKDHVVLNFVTASYVTAR